MERGVDQTVPELNAASVKLEQEISVDETVSELNAASVKLEQEMPVDETVSDEEVNAQLDQQQIAEQQAAARRSFSSENFKIEVRNLPNICGIGQMKKLINYTLRLNAHKLKPCGPKTNFMFICFKNAEDQQRAISVLDGFYFKGRKLKAFRAKAAKDPFKEKAEAAAAPEEVLSVAEVKDTRPIEEQLRDSVCSYAKMSYEDQLRTKQAEAIAITKKIGGEISRTNSQLREYIERITNEQPEGTLAPVLDILKSPVTRGYRNKCEFSVGYMEAPATAPLEEGLQDGPPGDTPKPSPPVISVGFRLATYKKGSVEVVSLSSLNWPEDALPNVSPEMIKIGIFFEQLIRASGILPYNFLTDTGNWRHITLRSAGDKEKQHMATVVLDPLYLNRCQLDCLRSDLRQFFTEGAGVACGLTTLFLHLIPARRTQGVPDPPPELIFGEPVIVEKLYDLSFKISPQAFFQVNTKAAEVLYTTVGELAGLDTNTTLLDVCCGIGTIGLCLSHQVKQVVGVELVPEAVRNALKNAEINGIKNSYFYAGKAEDILGKILMDVDSRDIAAIVDPPRAGLHPKALSAIRNTLAIRRLVYVSCDAKNAMRNFVDLARPQSNTAHGDPFLPTKVIPVDLFPHNPQFELVILFERVSWEKVRERLIQPTTPMGADVEPLKTE